AVMVVSSDPATYGQITVYKYEGTLTEGPATVAAELSSNPEIAPVITLLDQRGSRVILGQLQLVSIGDGLIWIQPLFVRPDDAGSRQVFVRRVLAWYDGRSVIGDTLSEAVNRLFPGANIDLGEFALDESAPSPDSGSDGETGGDSGGDTGGDSGGVPEPGGTGSTSDDPAELLREAEVLFDEADVALRSGDLGSYQSKVQQAEELISRALTLLTSR
ncbi:MAG: hypothetical protein ACKOBT_14980, partial [Actinomycetota bacterium]